MQTIPSSAPSDLKQRESGHSEDKKVFSLVLQITLPQELHAN